MDELHYIYIEVLNDIKTILLKHKPTLDIQLEVSDYPPLTALFVYLDNKYYVIRIADNSSILVFDYILCKEKFILADAECCNKAAMFIIDKM